MGKKTKIVPNPDLIILQSNLHIPTYFGVGKWVIFNPNNRKGFLAVGKDKIPDVIKILFSLLNNPIYNISESAEYQRLYKNEIIVKEKSLRKKSFLELYQIANLDYPFEDYFNSDWRNRDKKLMTSYAKNTPPPNIFTPRIQQNAIYLPNIDLTNFSPDFSNTSQITTINLSWLLKCVFGKIGDIKAYLGPWVRKTSPSGGARHPTECIVYIPESYYTHIHEGTYHYDPLNHSLIPTQYNCYTDEVLKKYSTKEISFLIISRVERSMWRYRDIRAFRPNIIDTGHIIENISLLLSFLGYYSSITPVPTPRLDNTNELGFLKEPPIALININKKKKNYTLKYTNEPNNAHNSNKLFTNPTLFFSFKDGKCYANSYGTKINSIQIYENEFILFQHCLFSRRQDRIVEINSLSNQFNISKERINELIENECLLPYKLGLEFYKETLNWANKNWYLSLLAYLNISLDNTNISFSYKKNKLNTNYSLNTVLEAMFNRKTTRTFSKEPIKLNKFHELLQTLNPTLLGFNTDNIYIYIAIFSIEEIENGIYFWNSTSNQIEAIGKNITPQDIRDITIGQECAGAGALTIWIATKIHILSAQNYNMDLIKLGRIGQRLCLSASHLNLGVFLTPALNDTKTANILGINSSLNHIFYTLTIGKQK